MIPLAVRVAQASLVVGNTPASARHPATSDAEGDFALELLPPGDYSACVVADSRRQLLLINKDQSNLHKIRITFDDSVTSEKSFSGPISLISCGSEQYMWKSDGPNGHPDPDSPPVTKSLAAGRKFVTLPNASVTVLCGKSDDLRPSA